MCPHEDRKETFTNALGERNLQIRNLINCSTERLIYMVTCPCKKIYIGMTKRPLKIRIRKHMLEIKAKDPEKPLTCHFAQCHRGNLDGMSVKGIYVLKLSARRGDFKQVLLQKEKL